MFIVNSESIRTLGRRNVKVDVLVLISEMLIRREFAED